jgi:signal transduction histidine kinase
MLQCFLSLIALLLSLAETAKAESLDPIAIWDGTTDYLEIQNYQMEQLGSDPELPKVEDQSSPIEHSKSALRWYRLRIENRISRPIPLKFFTTNPVMHRLIVIAEGGSQSGLPSSKTVSRRDQSPDAEDRTIRQNILLSSGLNTFYIGVSSYLVMQNFSLTFAERLHTKDNRFILFSGFILGGILVMVLTALVFYFGSAHRSILLYAVYGFSLFPLLLTLAGLLGLVLPAASVDWWEFHFSLSIQLATLGLLEFSISILNIKTRYPRIYRALRVMSALALLMILIGLTLDTDRGLWTYTQISSAITILTVIAIGLRISWHEFREIWFYIGGLGAFLGCAAITLIASFGFDVSPLNPALCIMTGALIQFFLLPFAIRSQWDTFAVESLYQKNQLKDMRSLLQILIHDMVGPLFVIQSMAELQESKPGLEQKTRNSFEKIRNASQSAQSMLKVVKELEAIELGKIDLVLKPVSLMHSLQTALDILKVKADAKQVKIEVVSALSEEDLTSLTVWGERTILEHTVFHNLLSNAIKFSQPLGTIQVQVLRASSQQIMVRVKDYGIGIPKTLVPYLFSHSAKTTRNGTAGEKGTGLGLPLAQRYTQKFGGYIDVQSQSEVEFPDDHWTEFTVNLKSVS